jgi:hypothetical protein
VSTAVSTRLTTLLRPVLATLVALLLSTCSIAPAINEGSAATPTVVSDLEPLPTESASAPFGDQQPASPPDEDEAEPAAPAPKEMSLAGQPTEPEASPADPAEPEVTSDPDPSEHAAGATLSEIAETVGIDEAPVFTSAEPSRVRIPRIGVDHPVAAVGLHPDRTLVVPDDPHVAGWYTGRPKPGDIGPAIITGHNQWSGQLGVFWDLHRLGARDVIEVHYDDGSVARFEIDRIEQHPKDAFPTERVYGDTDRAELRVITCGGHFDRGRRSHVDNVIAFGVLID